MEYFFQIWSPVTSKLRKLKKLRSLSLVNNAFYFIFTWL